MDLIKTYQLSGQNSLGLFLVHLLRERQTCNRGIFKPGLTATIKKLKPELVATEPALSCNEPAIIHFNQD